LRSSTNLIPIHRYGYKTASGGGLFHPITSPIGPKRTFCRAQKIELTELAIQVWLVYTVALNWYLNRNVRLMFDYLYGDVATNVSPTNFTDAG
jgi:phosphate-selective porin